ncbi:hypothetical protein J4219_07925 [Candidatus Woesearchaeota archaeon]|nr:hypothetical protein [Candidatus Woesearchaeota archaeon]
MIIKPATYVPHAGKTIFLAGPIQGAPNWQAIAVQYLLSKREDLLIANPRADLSDGKLSHTFEEQVDWETYHLKQAGHDGAILFWLAKETEHFCTRAYAQTTRFELGEWRMRHSRDGALLVIGIESGFTNERYIRHRLKENPDIPVRSTLEETCDAALKLIHN